MYKCKELHFYFLVAIENAKNNIFGDAITTKITRLCTTSYLQLHCWFIRDSDLLVVA